MADSQVSLRASLAYAWDLLRTKWRDIWGALALSALASTVVYAGLFAQNNTLVVAGLPAMLLTKYAIYGAVVRLGFGAEHQDDPEFRPGVMGLQWKRMELRMFGADLLLGAFQLVIGILLAIALTAPLIGVIMSHGAPPAGITTPEQLMQQLGPNGETIMQVEQFVLWAAIALIGIRLSLSLPASAESGRVAVLSTWKLTKGVFWRLAAASIVVALPLIVILTLIGAATAGPAGEMRRFSPSEAFVFALVCGSWAGAAITPLTAAVQVYFYRRLKAVGPT